MFKKTFLCLSLLGTLALPALASGFTDPNGLYTLDLPRAWTVEAEEDGSQVKLTDGDEGDIEINPENAQDNQSVDKLLSQDREEAQGNGEEILATGFRPLGKEKAGWVHTKASLDIGDETMTSETLRLVVRHGNRIYHITAALGETGENQGEVDRILNSWKWKR